MVFAFALLTLGGLAIVAGFTGRGLGETIRGTLGKGFALADINIPEIAEKEAPLSSGTATFASATDGVKSSKGTLLEVFFDPLKYYFDNGKINKGSIGGHGTHVHVGAEPMEFLHYLADAGEKQFHLTIREEPHYDPVDPVHVPGSLHYQHKAFDATGSQANMMAFAKFVIGEFA